MDRKFTTTMGKTADVWACRVYSHPHDWCKSGLLFVQWGPQLNRASLQEIHTMMNNISLNFKLKYTKEVVRDKGVCSLMFQCCLSSLMNLFSLLIVSLTLLCPNISSFHYKAGVWLYEYTGLPSDLSKSRRCRTHCMQFRRLHGLRTMKPY